MEPSEHHGGPGGLQHSGVPTFGLPLPTQQSRGLLALARGRPSPGGPPLSYSGGIIITSDRPLGEDSASSRPRPPALKAALVPVFWGLLPWHHLGEAARAGRWWGAEAGAGPRREGPREPQGVAAEGERGSQRHRGWGGTSLKSHQMEPGPPVGRRGNSCRAGGQLQGRCPRGTGQPAPPQPSPAQARAGSPGAAAGGAGRPPGRATGGDKKQKKAEPFPQPGHASQPGWPATSKAAAERALGPQHRGDVPEPGRSSKSD